MGQDIEMELGDSHPRIVRYADLRPCFDAFIDTRTPGSDRKENFTIIGPGVSENPNQHVHIAEPHGFNIGGARQPPKCINSQHSHDTAEVFYVHKGTWSFNLGEHGEDAKITLRPGDLISIPTNVFRGFENIGDDIGYIWAVLGGDDPGRVTWAPGVFDMAKDYGLVLMENGSLIDTEKGQTVPEGENIMPVTTREQVAALDVYTDAQLKDCCVLSSEAESVELHPGVSVRKLIGPGTKLSWDHGFETSHIALRSGTELGGDILDIPDVIFVHQGQLTVWVDGASWILGPGDTATIPKNANRSFVNLGSDSVEFVRVTGE